MRFEAQLLEFCQKHCHLRPEEITKRNQIVAECRTRLEYFGFSGRAQLIGSHARGTAIRPLSDIDVCLVFAQDHRTPDKLLHHTARLCSLVYPGKQIEMMAHAIRVFYDEITIDVVPAYARSSGYAIPECYPDTTPTWTVTNFGLQEQKVRQIERIYGEWGVHVLHILKYWNAKHGKPLKSYPMEQEFMHLVDKGLLAYDRDEIL